MEEAVQAAPLAAFEAKWTAAHPEMALALSLVPAADRPARTAFACIVCELEQAAFGIRESEPAAIKLQWWAEELARMSRGEARHPLGQALQPRSARTAVAPTAWYAAIAGAFAQRDAEPAPDGETQLAGYERLSSPLASIESALFGPFAVDALARARAAARALRETAGLGESLRDGRLPLPLDVLARHRLVRGDLARASPARTAASREWLAALAGELARAGRQPIGVAGAAIASADRWRARRASRAVEPLAALPALLGRLPMRSAFVAWRAARVQA
jgi:15-cis-phytoene synthase